MTIARLVVAVSLLALAGCAHKPAPPADSRPAAQVAAAPPPQPAPLDNALLWMRTSAEYDALCRQVYRQAAAALLLDTAANGAACDKPRAIVMDLDETVLDNSLFNVWIAAHPPASFGKAWEYWVTNHDGTARLVPGSLDFINLAKARGVDVIFISNRPETLRAQTAATLERLGVAPASTFTAGNLMLYPGGHPGKEPRRQAAARTHCIIALVGDNLADVSAAYEARRGAGPQPRTGQVEKDDALWGVRWFALPNPVYGDWKNALWPADLDAIRALAPPAMPTP